MVLCESGGRSLSCGGQLCVLEARIWVGKRIGKLLLMAQRRQRRPVFVGRMKVGEGGTRWDGLDGWLASPEGRLPVVLWSCRRHEGHLLRGWRREEVLGPACGRCDATCGGLKAERLYEEQI